MSSDKKKIRTVFILEIIGRPAEHLTETLSKLIDSMDKEKGVEVVKKDIKDVIEMKDKKDFFSTFCRSRSRSRRNWTNCYG